MNEPTAAGPVWLQLHVTTTMPEAVDAALWELGALSVTLTDAADQPLLEPAPGEMPLWDRIVVSALFDSSADGAALQGSLRQRFGSRIRAMRCETLADRAWEREWLKDFHPMRFGQHLWICPHGQTVPDPAAQVVFLDPGLAFGTGTHPTTRLCLEWLDGADLIGKRVLDYGCGSGVLAIAAARLGAAQVIAMDIDSQALTATRANAAANNLSQRIEVVEPQNLPSTPCDLVVANILAGTLIELAAPITAQVRAGGKLVMSGILAEQATTVAAAYAGDFEIAIANSEAWVRLDGRRFDSD